MKVTRWKRIWLLSVLVSAVFVVGITISDSAYVNPFILFTADTATDFSGDYLSQPATVFGVPADSHFGHLPNISPGVILSPFPAYFDGVETGPLNGVTYGPLGFGIPENTAGTTGWVRVTFTVPVGGFLQLTFEVADVIDPVVHSALAIDNIRLNGLLLEGFESGVPSGWIGFGSFGISPAVPNLAPTEGASFAFIDTQTTLTSVLPMFDKVDGVEASQLIFFHEPPSPFAIIVKPGDILEIDLAFLTNDGDIFHDYAVVQAQITPEPSTFLLLGTGIAGIIVYRRKRRNCVD